ncbi:hypothetical protein B484DRAFT_456435 [Ochromonadaceae sp. CCMP2298]|nr:hypothetical protein B484DRAFT_456435 [Ochromonadaceae sp. CCMP2298]|mmetsp:Transcript_7118/g.15474  ORF Transcript_7118/g.15474 Transcript_7118/m.15474 type:complete len:503 (+) Transcript_7118:142-1650(+)|eukprot:CAMPEP_0173216844 /NCGR_PEP_ID=MMETSP1142-20121109/148_1 /TAXON_ID=483371 /ORGANISM="non described non described, Strain CCMP2298" /LENGTH=502 /DNA_ID=CAMNT_0014144323 /DNA_START=88 /DNA_END=1596 /DNA_ORIENTATION=-
MASFTSQDAAFALRECGRLLFLENKFQQALDVFTDEVLRSDPVAASNAAEASLQLKMFETAEIHALRALELDSSHVKSMSRLSRARAAQGKLAEAHRGLLAAPLAGRAALHKHCATKDSVYCSHFAEGAVLCAKGTSGNVGVFAQRNFKRGECVVREKAVVPWTKEDVWENPRAARLLAHLRTPEGKEQAGRIGAMFPRTYEDIPLCVPSMGALRGRVENLLDNLGNTDEDEIRESTRLLAVVKLNSHDDGCHGFGTFFNHSCGFNCEVRGVTDMDVYCCRDISTGEEMNITYMDIESLDKDVDMRRLAFTLGWGVACDCARCNQEQPEALEASELIRRRFEWEGPGMKWAHDAFLPLTRAIEDEPNEAARLHLVLSLMRSLQWRGQGRAREILVLDYFSKNVPFLSQQLTDPSTAEQIPAQVGMTVAVLGVNWLVELYERRLEVFPEHSVLLFGHREALLLLMGICVGLGRATRREGWDSVEKLISHSERLLHINSIVYSN